MIKIPKSMAELKSMLSDANIGDALSKVQAQINTASSNVQAAAAAMSPVLVEGELGEVIEQLKRLHEQEIVLLKRLAELTHAFQKQVTALKQAAATTVQPVPPVEPPEPVTKDAETISPTVASENTSEKEAAS